MIGENMLPDLPARIRALISTPNATEIAQRAGVHKNSVLRMLHKQGDRQHEVHCKIAQAVTEIELARRDELLAWHGLPEGEGR